MDIVSTSITTDAQRRELSFVSTTTFIKPEVTEDPETLVDPLEIKPDISRVKLEQPDDEEVLLRVANIVPPLLLDVKEEPSPSVTSFHNPSQNTCYKAALEANSQSISSNKYPLATKHFSNDADRSSIFCHKIAQPPLHVIKVQRFPGCSKSAHTPNVALNYPFIKIPLLMNTVSLEGSFFRILPRLAGPYASQSSTTDHLIQVSGQEEDLGMGRCLENGPVYHDQQPDIVVPTVSVAQQTSEPDDRFTSDIKQEDEDSCSSESSFKMEIDEEVSMSPTLDSETLTEFTSVFLPNSPDAKPFVRYSDSHNPVLPKNTDIPSKFQCLACQKTFDSIFTLAKHYDSLNSTQPCKLSCRFCFEPFPNISRLHRHLKTHESNPRFECGVSYCPKSFTSITKLARHIQSHLPQLLYKCTICETAFDNIDTLQNHILKDHRNDKQNFVTCIICNEPFHKDEQQTHMALHKKERLWCTCCDVSFGDRCKLENHLLTEHNIPMQPKLKPRCEICKRRVDETRFQKHMDAHKAQFVTCEVCHKTFPKMKKLKSHMEVHKKKSETCKTCSKTFTDIKNLKCHMEMHKTKSATCTTCSKTFTNTFKLKKHEFVVHTLRPVETETIVKPEKCPKCNKVLKNKHGLAKHMKLHGKGKPFCMICKKGFKRAKELSAHNFKKHSHPLDILFRGQDPNESAQTSSQ